MNEIISEGTLSGGSNFCQLTTLNPEVPPGKSPCRLPHISSTYLMAGSTDLLKPNNLKAFDNQDRTSRAFG